MRALGWRGVDSGDGGRAEAAMQRSEMGERAERRIWAAKERPPGQGTTPTAWGGDQPRLRPPGLRAWQARANPATRGAALGQSAKIIKATHAVTPLGVFHDNALIAR